MNANHYIKRLAIEITQRFGTFYVTKFTAEELLQLSYSDPYIREGEKVSGNQRALLEWRRKEIRKFIESTECAFPNSIILAANFAQEDNGQITENEDARWAIKKEGDLNYLYVPQLKKMAVIIDGQHRVFGFKDAMPETRDMELVCSIYFDLPSSLQAYLFATINSTQKAVDRSLAYELFGYDIDSEDVSLWSPDKLSISLCRKLNSDGNSPFYKHIKPGGLYIDEQANADSKKTWEVSTSCIVDNILRLITSNPKDDKSLLYKFGDKKRNRIKLGNYRRDSSPFRSLYVNGHDGVIYTIICNFFNAVIEVFESSFDSKSALSKTIGIQGLFDVLRLYTKQHLETKKLKEIDFTQKTFINFLSKSETINFSDPFFMKFSGVGRSFIRDAILVRAGLKKIEDVSNHDMQEWLQKNLTLTNEK